jgi:hypothetical protein
VRRRLIGLILSGAMIGTAVSGATGRDRQGCPIRPVKLSITGGESTGLTIELSGGALLGDPNGSKRAMVWDEPMKVHRSGGAVCAVDPKVGVITAPMFDAGGRVLYVTTYSGSHSILFAVNTANCDVLWASQPFTTGPVLVGRKFVLSSASSIIVGDNCLPAHIGAH